MNQWKIRAQRYRQAVTILPQRLRQAAQSLAEQEQARVEEVRLRACRPLMIHVSGAERVFPETVPNEEDLLRTLETATKASYHAALNSLREGFFTLPGGHRLGLSGTAVVRDGAVSFLKEPSSLVLRIAHDCPGAAEGAFRELFWKKPFRSTLILSPPGVGKTTFLRDMVRLLSDEGRYRISLVDERSEVAALHHGVPQLNVGLRTDVLEGCFKGRAIPMMLRSLAPEIIALDEITQEEDLAAMRQAAHCGTWLLATAHADDEEDLQKRPLYRKLMREELFSLLIVLERDQGERRSRWKEVSTC